MAGWLHKQVFFIDITVIMCPCIPCTYMLEETICVSVSSRHVQHSISFKKQICLQIYWVMDKNKNSTGWKNQCVID